MTVFCRNDIQEIIVNHVNAPLRDILMSRMNPFRKLIKLNRLIEVILKGFPDPTIENTWHPNTHRLIVMRDDFFTHLKMPSRHKVLWAIWKYTIYAYDYVPVYRYLIDRTLELWLKSGWEFSESTKPERYWE